MIYVNKRTGATIDSPCLLSGDDWELISEALEAEEVATVEEADAKEVEEEADAKEVEEAAEAEEVKEEKPKRRNNKKGE